MRYRVKVTFKLKDTEKEEALQSQFSQSFVINKITELEALILDPYHIVVSLNVEIIESEESLESSTLA